MTIKKLLKRFLKDENIYGSELMKNIIAFMNEFNDAIAPFNAFRWDTTLQGHDYWFEKEIKWLVFLHKNFNNIDNKEKEIYCYLNSQKEIVDRLRYISSVCCRGNYLLQDHNMEAVNLLADYGD